MIIGVAIALLAGLLATLVFFNVSEPEAEALAIEPIEAAEPVFVEKSAPGVDGFYTLDEQIEDYEEQYDVEVLPEDIATGLYGGTEENTCDPERLIAFLVSNPDLGEAWAQVIGIGFDEIPDYIRSLEIQTLAEDLDVLNHGYDEQARASYEINSTLAAGTAVLADKDGEVKTRCYCGNPIRPKPPTGTVPRSSKKHNVNVTNVNVTNVNVTNNNNTNITVLVNNPNKNQSRCIIFGSPVLGQPNDPGSIMTGVPYRVDLTGRETFYGGNLWTEVTWGSGANQTGWVQSAFLARHYCRPAQVTWCAGPGVVPVFNNPVPSSQTQIGELNVSLVTSSSTNPTAFVIPVGGNNHVEVNGFVLVRYQHAAPSNGKTAWVAKSDLNQDLAECAPVIECIATTGDIEDRIGGAVVQPAGTHRVLFTGHHGPAPATHAQVQLIDAGGGFGWVDYNYTVLPASDCDPAPPVLCVETPTPVWNSPTTTNPADKVGLVHSATVTVIGGPTGTRVEVELSPTGPTGWIDSSSGTGQNCGPQVFCMDITQTMLEDLDDPTSTVAGTPAMAVNPLTVHGKVAYHGGSTYRYVTMPSGDNGWAEWSTLQTPSPGTCDPVPPEVECVVEVNLDTKIVSVGANTTPPGSYTYTWYFGDGNQATTKTATHDYSSSGLGPFTISLTVSENGNQIDSVECGIVEFEPEDWEVECENLGTTLESVALGTPVGPFRGSVVPNTTIVSTMEWDFGDNSGLQPGVPDSPSHTYQMPGTYVITVTVTDDLGNVVTVPCHEVTVEETEQLAVWCEGTPSPSLYGQPITVNVGWAPASTVLDVDFEWKQGSTTLQAASVVGSSSPASDLYSSASPPDVVEITWDNPTDPTANGSGNFLCAITVCDQGQVISDGACQDDWELICENWGPTAATIPLGTQVGDFHLDSQGNASISWFEFNFGEGTVSNSDPSGTHVYSSPGTYTVTLTATANGVTKTVDCYTVTVVEEEPPELVVDCAVEPGLVAWGAAVTAVAYWSPASAMDLEIVWYSNSGFLHQDSFIGTGPGSSSTYGPGNSTPDYVVITITDPNTSATAQTECAVESCPQGYDVIDGECTYDEPWCGTGRIVDGECVTDDACPEGQQLPSGGCCPAGTVPRGTAYGEECVATDDACPEGQQLPSGGCCPAGTVPRGTAYGEECVATDGCNPADADCCPSERQVSDGCCPPGSIATAERTSCISAWSAEPSEPGSLGDFGDRPAMGASSLKAGDVSGESI